MKNLVFVLSILCCFFSVTGAPAAGYSGAGSKTIAQSVQSASSGNDTQTQSLYDNSLQAFEQKLFGRTFSNETPEQRLDRIEAALFGAPKSGPIDRRMNKLLLDAPLYGVLVPAPPFGATDTQPPTPELQTPANSTATSDGYLPSDYGNYPTVTALEEQILGRTNTNLPVQERLAQMETKAFGQPSTSNDLSARVDRLKQYVASNNNNDESYLESTPEAITNSTRMPSMLDAVSQMENEVYGKTYGRDTLVARINRLDKTVFAGKNGDQTFTPLVVRIQQLIAALNQNKIVASTNTGRYSQTYNAINNEPKKSGHPILHKLGKFLGGVGTAAGIALGSMAYGSALGYGYGYGYGGWGYPGFGMPYYGGYYGYPRFW